MVYPLLYRQCKRKDLNLTNRLECLDESYQFFDRMLFKRIQQVEFNQVEEGILREKLYYGLIVLVIERDGSQEEIELIRALKERERDALLP